jgi:hypothetical protein
MMAETLAEGNICPTAQVHDVDTQWVLYNAEQYSVLTPRAHHNQENTSASGAGASEIVPTLSRD